MTGHHLFGLAADETVIFRSGRTPVDARDFILAFELRFLAGAVLGPTLAVASGTVDVVGDRDATKTGIATGAGPNAIRGSPVCLRRVICAVIGPVGF